VPRPAVIFLSSPSWEARYQAATLAVTAAALGDAVTVALAFEPLRLWVAGRFDEGAPPTAAAARVAPLRATLDEARRALGLRVVACETLVRLAGLDPGEVRSVLDEVTTLPSLWRLARAGQALAI
jgi:peroxiredoxin family protein